MTQRVLDLNPRNQLKQKMEDRCFEAMVNHPEFCDDNTHTLACRLIEDDFGVTITPEIITRLMGIDRSRRKVLKRYPQLDKRIRSSDLEKNDKDYYGWKNK